MDRGVSSPGAYSPSKYPPGENNLVHAPVDLLNLGLNSFCDSSCKQKNYKTQRQNYRQNLKKYIFYEYFFIIKQDHTA